VGVGVLVGAVTVDADWVDTGAEPVPDGGEVTGSVGSCRDGQADKKTDSNNMTVTKELFGTIRTSMEKLKQIVCG